MSDLIIGISLLASMEEADPETGITHHSNFYFLYVTALKSDGLRYRFHIPCHPLGTPRPKLTACWQFQRDGRILHVTPSVHDTATGFHNAGAWDTEFVEWDKSRIHGDLAQIHAELNYECLSAEQVQQRLTEFLAEGVLLPRV